MDAITLLKQDHREVEELFSKFEDAGSRAKKSKRSLVDRMIKELSVHAAIEEQIFYPTVRNWDPDQTSDVLESLEEHGIVKWVLSELEGMSPDDERFDAKVTVLIELVRHHVKEEEREMFPSVRKAMDKAALNELGDRLSAGKKVAPTRPHPRSPDTPPGNLLAGAAAGVIDKARDVGRQTVERVRTGV